MGVGVVEAQVPPVRLAAGEWQPGHPAEAAESCDWQHPPSTISCRSRGRGIIRIARLDARIAHADPLAPQPCRQRAAATRSHGAADAPRNVEPSLTCLDAAMIWRFTGSTTRWSPQRRRSSRRDGAHCQPRVRPPSVVDDACWSRLVVVMGQS